jgi:hypothetical protein
MGGLPPAVSISIGKWCCYLGVFMFVFLTDFTILPTPGTHAGADKARVPGTMTFQRASVFRGHQGHLRLRESRDDGSYEEYGSNIAMSVEKFPAAST